MKKLNWNLLSQLEIPLRILENRKVCKVEFNKGFIAKVHNGFFVRFLNLPKDLDTFRVYLNIMMSDGSKFIKACLLDPNIHDRYVQFEEYPKGEELLMEIKLTSEPSLDKEIDFVLEEA